MIPSRIQPLGNGESPNNYMGTRATGRTAIEFVMTLDSDYWYVASHAVVRGCSVTLKETIG